MSMGIWMTIGPRQPIGFTPASRYNFMVSWETRARSLLYRSLISCILGWSWLILRIERICFKVRGRVTRRTRMVNRMMAMPIWLKLITYNTTRVLSMGRIISSFQRNTTASKESYLLGDGVTDFRIRCHPQY